MIGVALGTLGAGNCTVSIATMVSIKEISGGSFEWPKYMGRISLKFNTTIGCVLHSTETVLKFLFTKGRGRQLVGIY